MKITYSVLLTLLTVVSVHAMENIPSDDQDRDAFEYTEAQQACCQEHLHQEISRYCEYLYIQCQIKHILEIDAMPQWQTQHITEINGAPVVYKEEMKEHSVHKEDESLESCS